MLTVIIECENDEARLVQTLSALVAGAVEGLVSDVILVDRGSSEATARLADQAGCKHVFPGEAAGALAEARGRWVMLIEPGARPEGGWVQEVADYLAVGREPARFSLSQHVREPWFRTILRRGPALERGLILPHAAAMEMLRAGRGFAGLAAMKATRTLAARIVPARLSAPL